MRRRSVFSYLFVPILVATFAIAWAIDGIPVPETLPERQMEPARHAQSNSPVSLPESGVRYVHHGPNHPPVVDGPVCSRTRVVLFPAGPGTDLKFEGDPASDYEEDIVTYRFGIAIPGRLGIRSPDEALLCVDRYGSRFVIRPRSNVTPAEFASVYGNVGIVPVLPAVIYASDGKSESKPVLFNLGLVYDESTGNSKSSESMGGSAGVYPAPADRFEEASDSVDSAYEILKKVADESRVWRLDPPAYFTSTAQPIDTTR